MKSVIIDIKKYLNIRGWNIRVSQGYEYPGFAGTNIRGSQGYEYPGFARVERYLCLFSNS